MRTWMIALALVLGLALGAALGFALDDPSPQALIPEDEEDAGRSVPPVCLMAIEAARQRLLLTGEIEKALSSYRDLGERTVDGVKDLSIEDLQSVVSEFEDLNEDAAKIIDRSVKTSFSDSARRCEEIAGIATPSPTS